VVKIKRLYVYFTTVFVFLFINSSAFVDPRSWWSLYETEIINKTVFSARLSEIHVAYYALASLVLASILYQPFVKKAIKKTVINCSKRIQLSMNVVKSLLN